MPTYNPGKYGSPSGQARTTGRIVTVYKYQPWSPWKLVYTRSTGAKVYQRTRQGRQIHHYKSGRREVGSWAKYKQSKTVFPSDYGKRVKRLRAKGKKGYVRPEVARKHAGKTFIGVDVPRGVDIETGRVTGGEKPRWKEPKEKVATTPEAYSKFYYSLPEERKKLWLHPTKYTLAQAGITPEAISKFEKISLPPITEKGLFIEGITVFPRSDPEAYKKLVRYYRQMERQYTGIRLKDAQQEFLDVTVPKEHPELYYLFTYADKLEVERLKKAMFESDVSFSKAYESAWKSLSEKEKEEYGFRFKPFISEPLEEWKYHPGGVEYLKSLTPEEKEALLIPFVKSYKELIPGYGRRYYKVAMFETKKLPSGKIIKEFKQLPSGAVLVSPDLDIPKKYVSKATKEGLLRIPSKYLETKWHKRPAWETKKIITWEFLTHRDYGAWVFKKLPLQERIMESASQAFAEAVVFPVTLPQMVVKHFTGKTHLLPDIALELEKGRISPPGVIGASISEVWLGRKAPRIRELHRTYPLESAFATVGEIVGLYFGGKMIGVGVRGVRYVGRVTKPYVTAFGRKVVTGAYRYTGTTGELASRVRIELYAGKLRLKGFGYRVGRVVSESQVGRGFQKVETKWFGVKEVGRAKFREFAVERGLITRKPVYKVRVTTGVRGLKYWSARKQFFYQQIGEGRYLREFRTPYKDYFTVETAPRLGKITKTMGGKAIFKFPPREGFTSPKLATRHYPLYSDEFGRVVDVGKRVGYRYITYQKPKPVSHYRDIYGRYAPWMKEPVPIKTGRYVPRLETGKFPLYSEWDTGRIMDVGKRVGYRYITYQKPKPVSHYRDIYGRYAPWMKEPVPIKTGRYVPRLETGKLPVRADQFGRVVDVGKHVGYRYVKPSAYTRPSFEVITTWGKQVKLQTRMQYPIQRVVGKPTFTSGGVIQYRYSLKDLQYVKKLEVGVYRDVHVHWKDVAPVFKFGVPSVSLEQPIGAGLRLGVFKPGIDIKFKPYWDWEAEVVTVGTFEEEFKKKHRLLPGVMAKFGKGFVLDVSQRVGLDLAQGLEQMQMQRQALDIRVITKQLAKQQLESPTKPVFPVSAVEPVAPIGKRPPRTPKHPFRSDWSFRLRPWRPNGAEKIDWSIKEKPVKKIKKKRKKRVLLKTILSDPFSVQKSQIVFGKATHPLPTKKIWSLAEKRGFKLETVELLKAKGMVGYGNLLKKKKYSSKRKKKKKKKGSKRRH